MGVDIQLQHEDAESIDRLVELGRFASRDEAIHEAIRLVNQHDDWLAMVERKVAQGRADFAAGRTTPIDHVREEMRGYFGKPR